MAVLAPIRRALVAVLVMQCWFFSIVQAADPNFLEQSFSFSWDSNLAVPVPVTTQCDTLNIAWSRGTNTGPNPVAPYYLQIYTSAYVFPFVVAAGSSLNFDFAVPFGAGTLYQICMFDSQGNTGGCQGIYTVIANSSSSSLSCSNSSLTFPLGPLDVDAEVSNGALSQYGWINSCTDISVTPKNGTGPYTFTIAPTLHPPWNITSDTASTMNWTVELTWGAPFFISVADSAGNYWSYGPLHSGEGDNSCLVSDTSSDSTASKIPASAVAGAGVGGLVLGLLVGGTSILWIFRKRMQSTNGKTPYFGLDTTSPGSSPTAFDTSYHSATPAGRLLDSHSVNASLSATDYQVEPFVLPETTARRDQRASTNDPNQSRSVYVVHHDGGRAPVTVYHEDGTEVVELPPRYIDGGSATASGSQLRSPSNTLSDTTLSDIQASSDGNNNNNNNSRPVNLFPTREPQSTPKKARSRLQPQPPSS